jgi:hypothetical protein
MRTGIRYALTASMTALLAAIGLGAPAAAVPVSDVFTITDLGGNVLEVVTFHRGEVTARGRSFQLSTGQHVVGTAALSEPGIPTLATEGVTLNDSGTGQTILYLFPDLSVYPALSMCNGSFPCVPQTTGLPQDLTSLLYGGISPALRVSVTSYDVIPEPAAAGLLLAGLVGLAGGRRRRGRPTPGARADG